MSRSCKVSGGEKKEAKGKDWKRRGANVPNDAPKKAAPKKTAPKKVQPKGGRRP